MDCSSMYKSTLPHRIYTLASKAAEGRKGLLQRSISHYGEAVYVTRRGYVISVIYTIIGVLSSSQ